MFLILLAALLLNYGSAYMLLYCESDRRSVAGEMLLTMVGALVFAFFDMLLTPGPRRKVFDTVNMIYIAFFLLIAHPFVGYFLGIHFLPWVYIALYTAYFIYLARKVAILRPETKEPDGEVQ